METKSRYEVLADLENQKRQLIVGKSVLDDEVRIKEIEIRDLKRNLEDKEDNLKDFKDKLKEKKSVQDDLIATVEEGLKRFNVAKS